MLYPVISCRQTFQDHITRGDVRDIINDGFDMMICHPPCTHLAVSGARWFKDKQEEQKEALEFVRFLMDAPIEKIALENPVSIISSRIRETGSVCSTLAVRTW